MQNKKIYLRYNIFVDIQRN